MRFLTFILFLFSYITVFGQDVGQDINDIENETIHIVKLNQTYSFGSGAQLQKAFGKAKIKKERDEVLGGYAYTYYYKGFETYFNEKNWESTTITSPKYIVFLNGVAYKVGDHINKLKVSFPLSYRNRNQYNNHIIAIMISHHKVIYDAEVAFVYDKKGYITKISISNDNS